MKFTLLPAVFIIVLLCSCQVDFREDKPNIILIMADDMGYECLGCYGSRSYQTPVLDRLAKEGILFKHCISQPLCTPSRVKIMTGLYNYRNYDYFGHLHNEAYTFGNLMRDAGYATCIVGKWQLNGLAYKDDIPYWKDPERPIQLGFDEYCLWQLTRTRQEGERFADPLIEQNGEVRDTDIDDYGPDIFTEYILDFIDRKKNMPFFIYYPMVLVHEPFVPTPGSKDWADPSMRYHKDTAYFKDMVAYTDKIVGKISESLVENGLRENTILIFTGDNGTHTNIHTYTAHGIVQGGKGNTIDAGVHVPLIITWPARIKSGLVHEDLIEFSDFFPTFSDIVGIPTETDGKSFYPLLSGEEYIPRETAFVHYDPKWGANVNQYKDQFIQTTDYKLYRDGRFYNLSQDILEKSPLDKDSLDQKALQIRDLLHRELMIHPEMTPESK